MVWYNGSLVNDAATPRAAAFIMLRKTSCFFIWRMTPSKVRAGGFCAVLSHALAHITHYCTLLCRFAYHAACWRITSLRLITLNVLRRLSCASCGKPAAVPAAGPPRRRDGRQATAGGKHRASWRRRIVLGVTASAFLNTRIFG